MSLTLPPNVRIDDNTGLYIITNSKGQTFRVNAQDQTQLNAYVQSVNTNTPTTITAINPATGLPVTTGFNPEFILNQRKENEDFFALQKETKRKTGIVGNRDGTYTDLKSDPLGTLTFEQAQARISAAGLPPNALASVTPKNSPTYFAATRAVDETTNTPSNLPPSPQPTSEQPPPAISSDNTNLSASSDPNTNPGAENAGVTIGVVAPQPVIASSEVDSDPVTPIDQSIIDANEEPQNATDLQFSEQQSQLAEANEPPAVDNDPAYNSSFADDAAASAAAAPVNSDLYGYEYDGAAPYATSNTRGISGDNINARSQSVLQDSTNFGLQQDWRVRLTLAPGADGYLYKASDPGILRPLISTKGIIFPYTPQVNVTYTANYDPTTLTHSNYKILQYQNSAIENVQITGDFTAQDTFEADYLLAVIHFLRTCTKMFYGQDQKPKLGTPPPMLFLKGFGAFQFDMHPLVITNFTYNLPNDVDYIRASSTTTLAGVSKDTNNQSNVNSRLPNNVTTGGNPAPVVFNNPTSGSIEPTYVPTKLQIQIACMPVVSRKDVSDRFSFKNYASGQLLRGSKQNNPGIW